MSYWSNEFMPMVDGLAYPLIKELAIFTDYTEEELRTRWHQYVKFAYEEAGGDVSIHFDQTIDNLKDFFNDVCEHEL